MGTLLILETVKNGYNIQVSTTTSDLNNEEEGTINIWITGNNQKFSLNICVADYTDRWINKFINVFCVDAEFRNKFPAYPVAAGKTGTI